jgi:hypothetical protein
MSPVTTELIPMALSVKTTGTKAGSKLGGLGAGAAAAMGAHSQIASDVPIDLKLKEQPL